MPLPSNNYGFTPLAHNFHGGLLHYSEPRGVPSFRTMARPSTQPPQPTHLPFSINGKTIYNAQAEPSAQSPIVHSKPTSPSAFLHPGLPKCHISFPHSPKSPHIPAPYKGEVKKKFNAKNPFPVHPQCAFSKPSDFRRGKHVTCPDADPALPGQAKMASHLVLS